MKTSDRSILTTKGEGDLLSRANRLALPIKKKWGKHFPIVEVKTGQIEWAAIDFNHILLGEQAAEATDAELELFLMHEWMHRIGLPKSPANNDHIHDAVRQGVGKALDAVRGPVDLAIELIVDRLNMDQPDTGKRYRETGGLFFEQHILLENPYPGTPKLQTPVSGLFRLANFQVQINDERWEASGEVISGLLDCLFQDWPGDGNPNDVDDLLFIARITRFTRDFLREFPSLPEFDLDVTAPWIIYRPIRTHWADNELRLDEMDMAPQALHQRFDLSLSRQITDRLFTSTFDTVMTTGRWLPGHPLQWLDIKRSYRTWHEIIPGRTTRRQIPGKRLSQKQASRGKRMLLVLDDSGSMNGKRALFARSLAHGVALYCARRKIETGLITFGAEVDTVIFPSHRLSSLCDHLAVLNGNLGGTNLHPALAQALRIQQTTSLSNLVLITDAEAYDWDRVEKQLLQLATACKITLFLINGELNPEAREQLSRTRHPIRIFRIDPDTRLEQHHLKELVL